MIQDLPPLNLRPWGTWWREWTFTSSTLKTVSHNACVHFKLPTTTGRCFVLDRRKITGVSGERHFSEILSFIFFYFFI